MEPRNLKHLNPNPPNLNRSLTMRLRLPRRHLHLTLRRTNRNQHLHLRPLLHPHLPVLPLHLRISPHRHQRNQHLQQSRRNLPRLPLSRQVLPIMLRRVMLLHILLRQSRPAPVDLDFSLVFLILLTMPTILANQPRRSQMTSE